MIVIPAHAGIHLLILLKTENRKLCNYIFLSNGSDLPSINILPLAYFHNINDEFIIFNAIKNTV